MAAAGGPSRRQSHRQHGERATCLCHCHTPSVVRRLSKPESLFFPRARSPPDRTLPLLPHTSPQDADRSIRADNVLPAFLLAQTVISQLLQMVDATTARSVEQIRQQCLSAVKDALVVRKQRARPVARPSLACTAATKTCAMCQVVKVASGAPLFDR